MKIGILDIDTKKEKLGNERYKKFPNIACGQIYGYHIMRGDEVVYPYNGERVDRLYISTIFSWTKPHIQKFLDVYKLVAKEIIIGGTGWDWKSKLPPEMQHVDPKWTYKLYDIDYGIGFTTRGCHVGCSFCVVPKKEGLKEVRVATIGDLVNPKSNHIVLLNNNSLAHDSFFEDIEEIKERNLTVNFNQANDLTIVTPKHAEALASVKYRAFNRTSKMLHFALDQMVKTKVIMPDQTSPIAYSLNCISNDTKKITEMKDGRWKVEFDMIKLVEEKARLLQYYKIKPSELTFYTLIGFDTTLEEDLERVALLKRLGCRPYAMQFKDLNGKPNVDGRGEEQGVYVKHLKRWINSFLYRDTKFEDYEPYKAALERGSLF